MQSLQRGAAHTSSMGAVPGAAGVSTSYASYNQVRIAGCCGLYAGCLKMAVHTSSCFTHGARPLHFCYSVCSFAVYLVGTC